MTTLPPRFLVHLPHRSIATDPFGDYLLVDSVQQQDGVWEIRVVPASQAPTVLVGLPNHTIAEIVLCRFIRPLPVEGKPTVTHRSILRVNTIAQFEATNEPIPVFQIYNHTDVMPPRLKRNVRIKSLPGTPHPHASGSTGPHASGSTGPHASGSTGPHASGSTGPHAADYIQHVPPSRSPAVDPFVARQLLELAQLKHEFCPITAEEYITGETAVMPCGHLFMRIAIEESFKRDAGKCPVCRRAGSPTFV